MDGKGIAKELSSVLADINKARKVFESLSLQTGYLTLKTKPVVSLMVEACNYIESNTKQLIIQVRLKD